MSVNGEDYGKQGGKPKPIQGAKKVKIVLNSQQTYVVYSSCACDWSWDVNKISCSSSSSSGGGASAGGDVTIRVAVLSGDKQTESELVLDQYADTYATGGHMSHSIASSDKQLHVQLEWTTKSMSGSSSGGELLGLALPHQQMILDSSAVKQLHQFTYDSVKGTLYGIVGPVWRMSLPAVQTSWRSERPVAPQRVDAIKTSLKNDTQWAMLNTTIDPYTFGKDASKLSRLALIADELSMTTERDTLLSKIESALTEWMKGENKDVLVYDTTYGGIVSSVGLQDKGADYGQAYYNDHHFHYGYILYACAVVSHFSPSFATTYREEMLALAMDYANPSAALDSLYTPLRHFDAYDGHSWASGLFAFGDARNQESSSESVNAYYAIALLGQALAEPALQHIGTTLMTLELHGVKRYWHMTQEDSVYPAEYTANKMVGMVWGTKVVDATWFASGTAYVHGIQMLPFTPVSEELLAPRAWVAEQLPVMQQGMAASKPVPTDCWIGFMMGTRAVLDANQAWEDVATLRDFDNGNSRTNLQYWIATRPQ